MKASLVQICFVVFCITLAICIFLELYYNRYYWRLVLRKKRKRRWDYLLWIVRALVVLLGLLTILMTMLKA